MANLNSDLPVLLTALASMVPLLIVFAIIVRASFLKRINSVTLALKKKK